LPQLRQVTATLNRNDLYEVSAWSNSSGLVFGVEPNFASMRFVPLLEGRFIDQSDIATAAASAFSAQKRGTALPGRPLLGETITINDIRFTVVGHVGPIGRGNNDFDNQKSTSRSPPCANCPMKAKTSPRTR